MLIRKAQLDAIRDGSVTLAFRRWRRPTVKAGGQLHTAVGLLEILAVDRIEPRQVTAKAARAAGHPDRDSLMDELAGREGELYRIELRYAGEDPRLALRGRERVDDEELAAIRARLDRMDRAARDGAWTRRVLQLLERRPRVRAGDLAAELGEEKPRFKANVRKLKNLGLTVSLDVGYELSPLGRFVLAQTDEKDAGGPST